MKNDYRDLMLYDDGDFDLFTPAFGNLFDHFLPRKNEKPFSKLLKTDIKENENSYELEIEMAGIDKKDVNLELKDGYLTIGYQSKTETEDKKENFVRRERHFGSASRSFYVGKEINEQDISASLNNGILKIDIPKKSPKIEQVKKIEIK